MTEREMVVDTYNRLPKSKNLIVLQEFPINEGSCDMILMGSNFIAIEFKLSNWKHAIIQAQRHLVAVDYSYICLPYTKRITETILQKARENAVGILQYQPKCNPLKMVLKAPKSKPWHILNKHIRNQAVAFICRIDDSPQSRH